MCATATVKVFAAAGVAPRPGYMHAAVGTDPICKLLLAAALGPAGVGNV